MHTRDIASTKPTGTAAKPTRRAARERLDSRPIMLMADPRWSELTTENIEQMLKTLRRQINQTCPRGTARLFATTLSRKPGADTVVNLEQALAQFPPVVVEEIVQTFETTNEPATTALVFYYGKEILYRCDRAVECGQLWLTATAKLRLT